MIKIIKELKKSLLIFCLALAVVFSSPLAALAGEATSAQEASPAQESSPVSDPPLPDPTSSPAPTTEAPSAPEASDAQEAFASDPSQPEDPEVASLTQEEDEAQEELERQQRIERYYQYLEDKAEYEKNKSGNVGDTTIDSGDANSSGVVVNNANGATVLGNGANCSACADPGGANTSVTNSNNGSGSDNSVSVSDQNTSTVTIDNDSDINNDLDFSANSGSNISSYNVGDTEITTGDANVSGVLINSTNQTGLGVVEFNILEDHMGDIILTLPENLWGCSSCTPAGSVNAGNLSNGQDSTNNIDIDSTSTSDTSINNNADLNNNFDLIANTGYNDTSSNVGNSTIETGDANVAANIFNLVNSTVGGGVAFVVNVFGDLIGDIIFPDSIPLAAQGGSGLSAQNTGNGSGSVNDINIDQNSTNNVDLNNLADIHNYLNIDANTGDNTTSANTGGNNSIETGDVDINGEVMTIANVNSFGSSDEPLWLILVNNMGTWTGNIIGALTGQNYSGSNGLEFIVGDDGQILAKNAGNGADSNNNISIASDSQNNLSIDNSANINNNLNIFANTGGNSANKNTGGNSSINTGDANVAASIVNFVNSNLIGRTVMIGIVNVFGTWIGDAVPPGEDPEPDSQQAAASTGGSSGSSSTGRSNSLLNNNNGNNSTSSSSSSNPLNQLSFASGGGSGTSGGLLSAIVGGFKTEKDGPDDGVLPSAEEAKSGIISLKFNWKLMLMGLLIIPMYILLRRRNLQA